ncbi:MAG: type II secretion system F family protein, partial [Verrucomicrobia bacterium]|nr:type II secretion system F family protein [Deltaproteobacteria bacterium]
MGAYSYRAIDGQSNIRQGRISAGSVDDVERILSGQGMTLIEAENTSFINFGDLFGIKFSQKDLLDFTYMLKLVINSGIPILTGIQDLMKGHSNKKITFAANAIYQGLDSGLSLSEVMDSQPRIFPPYYVHMVKAGEASGTLDNSLEFLMNYLNWQIEFGKTVRGALSYPITILTIMGGLIVIIFTVVFPKMLKLLSGLGAEMPLPTKIMVTTSGFLRNHFLLIAVVVAVLAASYQFFKRTPQGRRLIDRTTLRLPVIGSLVRKINLSRYFKIVATLHSAGLNVERTFIIGAEVVGNTVLSEKLRTISPALMSGDSISDAMRRTGYIQDLVLDMVSIAEKTGKLEDALNRASDILDKE